jgi:hypothetical protein
VFLIITSCALESEHALPNDEPINAQLIGEWWSPEHPNEKLTISAASEMIYTMKFEAGDVVEEITAHSKTINGIMFMNLTTIDNGKRNNSFYSFQVGDDTLMYSEVNEQVHEGEFESSEELVDFLTNNQDLKDFFMNPVTLLRK